MWTSATDQSRFVHAECTEPLFRDSYKRNNKSSGNKHLRCFPHCCNSHNATGYCGSTLQVATSIDHADLMVFAKFDLEDAETTIDVSSVVDVSVFDKYLCGRRVKSDASSGAVFEINSKRNSWHYGWVSSRFVKSTVQHQMKVYLMVPIDAGGKALCVDVLKSKSFFIESTRTGTKLQAKLLAQRQAPPATIAATPSRKRPHLVLEDPAALNFPSSKSLKSPPLPKRVPSFPDVPTSLIPRAPSPLTLRLVPSYQEKHAPPSHIYQPPSFPPPPGHLAPPAPATSFPWGPPPPPPTHAIPPAYYGYPPVSTTSNEHVLGNDSFLDALISGMDEDDDDDDLWPPPPSNLMREDTC